MELGLACLGPATVPLPLASARVSPLCASARFRNVRNNCPPTVSISSPMVSRGNHPSSTALLRKKIGALPSSVPSLPPIAPHVRQDFIKKMLSPASPLTSPLAATRPGTCRGYFPRIPLTHKIMALLCHRSTPTPCFVNMMAACSTNHVATGCASFDLTPPPILPPIPGATHEVALLGVEQASLPPH